MKARNTIILVVLLLVGVGYMLFRSYMAKRPAAPAESKKLEFSPVGGIARLTIAPAEGKAIVLSRSGDNWRLVEPLVGPADAQKVRDITAVLDTLQYTRKLKASDPDAETSLTGLDKPLWTVGVAGEAGEPRALPEERKLLIGQKVPVGGGQILTYVRLESDKDNVYEVSADFASLLDKTAADFRSKVMLDIPEDSITRLAVVKGSKAYELVKKGAEWRLVSPDAKADAAKASALVRQFAHLSASEFVDTRSAKNYAQYGLSKPETVVQVWVSKETATQPTTGAATQTATAPASKAAEEKYVLQIGAKNGSKFFAKLADSPWDAVFLLESTAVEQIPGDAADLRDTQVVSIPTAKIDAIAIEQEGQKAELGKKDGVWQMITPKPGKANADLVDKLLAAIGAMKAESFVDDPVSAAKASLDKPRCRLKLSYVPNDPFASAGGVVRDSVTLLIGGQSASGERTFVGIAGDLSVAAVKTADVEAMLAQPVNYCDPVVLSVPQEQVTRVELTRPDGQVALSREKGAWQLVVPVKAAAQADVADAILRQLCQFKADRIVAYGTTVPGKYAVAACVDVAVRVEAPAIAPTTSATRAAKPAAGVFHHVRVVKVDGLVYAWQMDEKEKAIGEFAAGVYDQLAGELRSRNVLAFDADLLGLIRIMTATATVELHRDNLGAFAPPTFHNVPWVCSDKLVKIDSGKVDAFLKDLQAVQAEKFVDPKTPDSTTKLDKPAVTLLLDSGVPRIKPNLELRVSAVGPTAMDRYVEVRQKEGVKTLFVLPQDAVAKLMKTTKDFEPGGEKAAPAGGADRPLGPPPGPPAMD